MTTCQGRTSECVNGPAYRVEIRPNGLVRYVCEPCHDALRAMGMNVVAADAEWVRRAQVKRLPAKEYAA